MFKIGAGAAIRKLEDSLGSMPVAAQALRPGARFTSAPGACECLTPRTKCLIDAAWPAAEIAKLTDSTLIVQGTSDIQTTLADANALASHAKRGTLAVIDGMAHPVVAKYSFDSHAALE